MPGAEVLPAAPAFAPSAVAAVSAPFAAAAVAVTAVTTIPIAAAVAVAAAEVLSCGLSLHDLNRHERQLAAVVDLADLDLDLVADLDHVIDVLNPGAAVQLAYLGDVQEPVLAWQ